MKKLLTAILALTMGVTCAFGLVACGKNKDKDDGKTPGDTNPPSTTVMTDEEIVTTAINNLKGIYDKSSLKEQASSYEVLGQTRAGDTLVTVKWTVSWESTEYDIDDYITVGEMNADKTVTIGVKKPPVAMEYLLTATVEVNNASKSFSFERSVPANPLGDEDSVSVGIKFDDAAKRTAFTHDVHSWEENGIKYTNEKYNSITNCDNVTNISPIRIYQGSKVKVEYPGMRQIVFDSVNYSDNPYADYLKASLEATNLPATITVDSETGDVTVMLEYAMDYIEFVATAQIRLYGINIDAIVGGATDAEKVAAAKALVSLDKTIYSEEGEYDLPSSSYGASVTWSVKGTSDLVKVEGGKLVVEKLPTAETAVTLVASIVSGQANDSTEVEIKLVPALNLVHKGTADDPFTVAEVLAIAATLGEDAFYEVNGKTAEICVEGYVIKVGSWAQTDYYANWTGSYIATSASSSTDSADALQIYRLNLDGTYLKSSTDLLKGAKIIVKGALQNFKGNTPEITNSGDINVVAVYYDATDIEPEPELGDVELPETDFPVTSIPELKALVSTSGVTTEEKYYAIGAVKSVSDAYNAPIYIVDEEGNELYVYGLRSEDGSTVLQTPSELFSVGDAIVVYGVMTNYNGTIEMQYAWLVQINEEAKTNVAKVLLAETTIQSTASVDFELPTAGGKISWAVTSGTGITIEAGSNLAKVNRTSEDQEVVLTATANIDGVIATKTYTVTVLLEVAGEELMVINADNLLAGTSSNAYAASGNATIDGYAFSWTGMGNYGWMQMRYNNASTGTSSFWNTDAFGGSIIKVEINWSAANDVPSGKTNNLKVEFANDVDFSNAKTELVTFTNDAKLVVLTLTEEYTYIRITHNNQGAVYLDNVKITYNAPSDEKTVAAEKAKVEAAIEELQELFHNVDENVTLPTAGKGVSIDWAVTSGEANLVEIANGKLTIKALPESENATLVITGTLTLNGATETVTYTFEIVSSAGDTRPDDEKVEEALKELKLDKEVLANAEDAIDLPASADEVSFAWSITSNNGDYVEISGNRLVVKSLPAVDTQVEIKVVATCGSESNEKTFTITVKADPDLMYGSLEHPLTSAKALEMAKALNSGAYTPKEVYATGYVISLGSWSGGNYNNFTGVYISDSLTGTTTSDDTLYVYRLYPDGTYINGESDLVLGAKITVYGYLQNYNGNTPQMTYNGSSNPKPVAYSLPTDEDKATIALERLELGPVLTEDYTMPAAVISGVTFKATANTNSAIAIEEDGAKLKVTRPAYDASDAVGNVTITATSNGKTATKVFAVTVTKESEPGKAEKAVIDISNGGLTASSTKLTKAQLLTALQKAGGTEAGLVDVTITGDYIYPGNTSGGLATGNDFLKLGNSSNPGKFKMIFDKEINKVELEVIGWSASEFTFGVNGTNKTPASTSGKQTLSYDITASTEIEITSGSKRGCIYKITVYYA